MSGQRRSFSRVLVPMASLRNAAAPAVCVTSDLRVIRPELGPTIRVESTRASVPSTSAAPKRGHAIAHKIAAPWRGCRKASCRTNAASGSCFDPGRATGRFFHCTRACGDSPEMSANSRPRRPLPRAALLRFRQNRDRFELTSAFAK